MKKAQWIGILALAVSLLCGAHPATAQLVNGDFETPSILPSDLARYDAGNSFDGWSVTSGNIEIIDSVIWQAKSGRQSLDLSGVSAGTISQNIVTMPGKTYRLSFWLSGNWLGGNTQQKVVDVSFGGNALAQQTVDYIGQSAGDMMWSQRQFDVTATGTTSTLVFASLNSSDAGAALDSVTLTDLDELNAVPEPSAVLLFLPALAVVGLARRKRNGASDTVNTEAASEVA